MILNFETTIIDLQNKIARHPLFSLINCIESLRTFMQNHVFCVWDFMCLMKALQNTITCTSTLWTPPIDGLGSHLVNTIIADEEGDINVDGFYMSHFEMYIEAMEEVGANTQIIKKFISMLQAGSTFESAVREVKIPLPAEHFIRSTFDIINNHNKPHQLCSAFYYGRENITYKMFHQLANSTIIKKKAKKLNFYLKRHIELDFDDHAPKARKLLMNLCGENTLQHTEVYDIAIMAIQSRIRFLDEVHYNIISSEIEA